MKGAVAFPGPIIASFGELLIFFKKSLFVLLTEIWVYHFPCILILMPEIGSLLHGLNRVGE